MNDAYKDLAHAIVLQAVKDYKSALRTLRRYPRYEPAKETKAEVEEFFRSQWFRTLTEIDGEMLIEKLQEAIR